MLREVSKVNFPALIVLFGLAGCQSVEPTAPILPGSEDAGVVVEPIDLAGVSTSNNFRIWSDAQMARIIRDQVQVPLNNFRKNLTAMFRQASGRDSGGAGRLTLRAKVTRLHVLENAFDFRLAMTIDYRLAAAGGQFVLKSTVASKSDGIFALVTSVGTRKSADAAFNINLKSFAKKLQRALPAARETARKSGPETPIPRRAVGDKIEKATPETPKPKRADGIKKGNPSAAKPRPAAAPRRSSRKPAPMPKFDAIAILEGQIDFNVLDHVVFEPKIRQLTLSGITTGALAAAAFAIFNICNRCCKIRRRNFRWNGRRAAHGGWRLCSGG